MSLMAMRQAVRRWGTPIWILLAFILVVGAGFAGLGSYLTGDRGGENARAAANEVVVATVGGTKVTRSELEQRVNRVVEQQRNFGMNMTPQMLPSVRLQSIQSIAQEQAILAAAKANGINVSDADIAAARDKVWKEQRPSFLSSLSLPATATDSDINRELAKQQPGLTVGMLLENQFPAETVRIQTAAEKLQEKFQAEAAPKVTDDQIRKSFSDIQVRHILVKSGAGGLPEAQAESKAKKLLDQVKANPTQFAQIADANTEDPGNIDPKTKKKNGGFYDWSPAGRYVPEFSDAALSVQPGQIVPQPVKTSFGYHVMKLEAIRPSKDAPKDMAEMRKQYIAQHTGQKVQEKLRAAVEDAQKNIQIVMLDPMLKATKLQQEAQALTDKTAREAKLNEALAALSAVKPADDLLGVAPAMKASIYETLDKPTEAIAAYKDALKSSNNLDTHLTLARLYLKQKDNASAVAQVEEAQQMVRGEIQSQFEIASLFRTAGRADLAAAADKKAKEMLARQAELAKEQQADGGTTALPPTTTNAPK